MEIKQGDKIFLGDRRTPFRAVTLGHLNGERAVGVCDSSCSSLLNEWMANRNMDSYGSVTSIIPILRWIPLEDLIRDHARSGWRERWQQLALPL